jgi:hypothetical protein
MVPNSEVFVFSSYSGGMGRDSSVSLVTGYGLDDPGIKVGVRFFAHIQTNPGAHPASCTMGTWSSLGVK